MKRAIVIVVLLALLIPGVLAAQGEVTLDVLSEQVSGLVYKLSGVESEVDSLESRIDDLEQKMERLFVDEPFIEIYRTTQSYWSAPTAHYQNAGWTYAELNHSPGKFAVTPGVYRYICTKTSNHSWHKIEIHGADDGWGWIPLGANGDSSWANGWIRTFDLLYCDQ